MLSESVDDRQYPFLAIQSTVKLPNKVVVIVKHLANPNKLFFLTEDAL